MNNLKTYESTKSVEIYLKSNILYKPEKIFIKNFKTKLCEMNMLDIGVGGGRTTEHFANLVKEYIGIDFSDNLIQACIKRYKDKKEYKFFTCDVRNL